MPLIINADDYGYCKQRNLGIIESFKKGHITSASLLINSYEVQHAVNLAAEYCLPLGLHFNITEGHPVQPPERVSSLLNTDGVFYGKKQFWSIAVADSFNSNLFFSNVHVERELKGQIEKFKDLTGYYPEFIDGHNHCHIANPTIAQSFAGVCKRWYPQIRRCRLPLQPLIEARTKSKRPKNLSQFQTLVSSCALSSLITFEQTFQILPKFIGLNLMGSDLNLENVSKNLSFYSKQVEPYKIKNSPHYFELMCHPGYKNKNGVGGCYKNGNKCDEFSQSEDREIEMSNLKEIAVYLGNYSLTQEE